MFKCHNLRRNRFLIFMRVTYQKSANGIKYIELGRVIKLVYSVSILENNTFLMNYLFQLHWLMLCLSFVCIQINVIQTTRSFIFMSPHIAFFQYFLFLTTHVNIFFTHCKDNRMVNTPLHWLCSFSEKYILQKPISFLSPN